jgi:monoamine oxidase
VSIRQADTGVSVVVKDVKSGATRQLTADYCVSCLPLAVLSGIDVNLSPATMAAVKATPYSPNAKMGLQMKRRFWEEDDRIFGGHLYSNLPFGQFAYPSGGLFGDKGVMLGFYGNGRMAGVADMPVKGRIEHVLTHASKVHPQMRTEYETGYCVWWEKIQYSLGATGGGGANPERLAVLGRPDNRIFLGCAAVSGNGGWQEGAVAAAWKQVRQLHERVMTAGSA